MQHIQGNMKLKPRGKRLALYQNLAVISLLGLLLSAHFDFTEIGGLYILALVVSVSRIVGLAIDANVDQYGLWGSYRGPDTLIEYEPGDKNYIVDEKN